MPSAIQDQLSTMFLHGLFDTVVLCSRQMTPFAIIELDDRSHLGREAADAQRDALMLSAGYHTLRYPGIPPVEQIRRDVEALLVRLTAPPQPATDLHYL